MAIDPKKIVKKLRGQGTGRGNVTLFMNVALYMKFQEVLKKKGISASKYFEQVMEQTIADLDKARRHKDESD